MQWKLLITCVTLFNGLHEVYHASSSFLCLACNAVVITCCYISSFHLYGFQHKEPFDGLGLAPIFGPLPITEL